MMIKISNSKNKKINGMVDLHFYMDNSNYLNNNNIISIIINKYNQCQQPHQIITNLDFINLKHLFINIVIYMVIHKCHSMDNSMYLII